MGYYIKFVHIGIKALKYKIFNFSEMLCVSIKINCETLSLLTSENLIFHIDLRNKE